MTPEQFVYWLRGYLYGKTHLSQEQLSYVFNQLKGIPKITPTRDIEAERRVLGFDLESLHIGVD